MRSTWKAAPAALLLLGVWSCASRSESAGREYIEQGKRFLEKGAYYNAELAYRKALEISPRSGDACAGLAEAQLKQRKWQGAMGSLRRAAGLMPGNVEVRVKLADLYLSSLSGQAVSREFLMRDLRGVLGELERLQPDGFDTLRIGGQVALAGNQMNDALALLRKADAQRPHQPALVLVLARTLIATGRAEEAKERIRGTLDREKSFGPLYDVLYSQLRAEGKPAEAESLLRAKVANNPNDAESRLQLAAHYASLGKKREMNAALQPLLESAQVFPDGYMQVGDFYSRVGDWSEAARVYEEGAQRASNRTAFDKRISDALLHQGRFDDARRMVGQILQKDPGNPYARLARASMLVEGRRPGEVEAALAELKKLAVEHPTDADIRLHLGQAYLVKGQRNAAEQEFTAAVGLQENYIPAQIALAEISLSKQSYGAALAQADEILARFPNETRAMLVRAAADVGLERYNDARTELRYLLDRNPDYFDGLLQLGLLELAEKDYSGAEQTLRKLYQPGRSDPRVVRGLVEIHLVRRQFEPALRLLEAELKGDPRYTGEIRQMLLDVAAKAGNSAKSQALAALQLARETAPGDPRALMLLAGFLLEDGRAAEAQACYRQVLTADPGNSVAMNNLAYSLAESGVGLDEAQRIAESAARKWPEQPNIADTMAFVYLKQNKTGKALGILDRLARDYPGNASFRYHLGMAWLQKGDTARAHRELRTALNGKLSKGDAERIRGILARIG